jgi:tRNA threonylcarbamoyladenosine biosynthesis protein TsaE
MNSKKILINDSEAMQQLAASIAQEAVLRPLGKRAQVFGLVGDLGAGKTTFTQGFLKALGVRRRVISPTFLIMRPYKLTASNYKNAIHIDCYRLHKSQELLALGFQELLENPENILLIEWPELMKKYLPRNTRWIQVEHPKKGTHRTVEIS